MTTDEVIAGLKAFETLAATLPAPLGPILAGSVAIGQDVAKLAMEDPTARLEELRMLLQRGIDADINERINK